MYPAEKPFCSAGLAILRTSQIWEGRAAGRGDMAGLFALVALLSTLADAVRLDVDLVRTCDRAVGALALTSSCVINSTTPLNATLCLAAVVSSLWWLRAGRAVRWRGSAAAHRGQGRYLLYHATWHWWGAACVCAVWIGRLWGRWPRRSVGAACASRG